MSYQLLQVLTIALAGMMVGNELSVAVFVHPALRRLPDNMHTRVRRDFAALFGRIMPFWYVAVVLLTIALAWMGPSFSSISGRWLLAAVVLWLLTIVYTLILPAPLNSRIAAWPLESVPPDWRAQARRWDRFHAIRMFMLVAALVCLIAGSLSA
ncbi:MAG TPA: DUF1772 domain-containing protein [Terriglobales bacterium]|jgi:hypothetical protein